MNLSQQQLNVLMTVLPRMKLSHVIWISQYTLPLDTLMNIRQAGMNRKIAARPDLDTELTGVSEFIDQIIKSKASRHAREGKKNLLKMLQGKDNAKEVMAQLQDKKYLQGEDNKGVKSEVISDMKGMGLSAKEAERASDYVSLLRMMEGSYDAQLMDTNTKLARKLKGFMPKGMDEGKGRGSEGANNDIVAILTTGNILNLKDDWEDISETRKQKKEGFLVQLEILKEGDI